MGNRQHGRGLSQLVAKVTIADAELATNICGLHTLPSAEPWLHWNSSSVVPHAHMHTQALQSRQPTHSTCTHTGSN